MGKPQKEQTEEDVSKQFKLSMFIILIFLLFLEGMAANNQYPSKVLSEAIGGGLVLGLIGYLCGNVCVKWAKKINAGLERSYAIGFFFGLLGILGYGIYYLLKSKKKIVIT
jgi:drug/metabolite transporter (DMT)-like permease